jgi:plastocyanin
MSETTRRRFLYGIGTGSTTAIAGCSSSGDTSGSGNATTTDGNPGTATTGESGGRTASKETSTVEMTNALKYVPKRIEVSTGTEVTWTTTGSIGHTITAYEKEIPDGAAYFASGGFDSQQAAEEGYSNGREGNVPQGESYSHTFETKGEYKYYCIPHETSGMSGYVNVV